MLAHLKSFVKNFFQVFSNFFFFRASLWLVARALTYVSTSQVICQELFSSFFKFLSLLRFALACRPSARIYYHLLPVLSSSFFDFFQKNQIFSKHTQYRQFFPLFPGFQLGKLTVYTQKPRCFRQVHRLCNLAHTNRTL